MSAMSMVSLFVSKQTKQRRMHASQVSISTLLVRQSIYLGEIFCLIIETLFLAHYEQSRY